jgi:hypothetical protein
MLSVGEPEKEAIDPELPAVANGDPFRCIMTDELFHVTPNM